MRADRDVDLRESFHCFANGGNRRGIVRIGPDEEFKMRIVELRDVVFNHVLDDPVLLPERHENSHPARRCAVDLFLRRVPAPEIADQSSHIDHKIVETIQQNPECEGRKKEREPVVHRGIVPYLSKNSQRIRVKIRARR